MKQKSSKKNVVSPTSAPLSVRLEDSVMARFMRVVAASRRTRTSIVKQCLEEHLPELEKQLERQVSGFITLPMLLVLGLGIGLGTLLCRLGWLPALETLLAMGGTVWLRVRRADARWENRVPKWISFGIMALLVAGIGWAMFSWRPQ